MADYTQSTRTVVHYEWTLSSPVHYSEIDKAYAVARSRRDELAADTEPRLFLSGIHVSARDETVVLWFTAEAMRYES